jgi:hypothetical protein
MHKSSLAGKRLAGESWCVERNNMDQLSSLACRFLFSVGTVLRAYNIGGW